MAPARFITFEGGEGTGKSTQAGLLAARLQQAGHAVVATREPGGSPFAERVRDFLLASDGAAPTPLAEALLFSAARADHVARTIRPALDAGQFVVCDRFADSTRVYQGVAGGLATSHIDKLEKLVLAGLAPGLTCIVDLAPEAGLARARSRAGAGAAADPFEARDLAFHERLRAGFLALAAKEPQRCIVLDGALPAAAIAERVWVEVARRFAIGAA
jgi:dTMP kinase